MLYVTSVSIGFWSTFVTDTKHIDEFPAKSVIFTFSVELSLKVFVNVLPSVWSSQPATATIYSSAVIVAIISLFVSSVVLYSTVQTGAILSILVISISGFTVFPRTSFTAIVSDVFSVYVFVIDILFDAIFQPSTSCIISFELIVTVTFPIVGFVGVFTISSSGGSLSILSIFICAVVSLPARSLNVSI